MPYSFAGPQARLVRVTLSEPSSALFDEVENGPIPATGRKGLILEIDSWAQTPCPLGADKDLRVSFLEPACP